MIAFRKNEGAYHRMFQRVRPRVLGRRRRSPGMMGGKESIDFLAPSGSGENTLVTCENGDFAADLEVANGVPRAAEFPDTLRRAERGRDSRRHHDRGSRRDARHRRRRDIEGDARHVSRDGASFSDSFAATTASPSRRCSRRSRATYSPATDEEIRAAFGAGGGSLGPVGVDVEVIADDALREGQFVAGANRDGWHLRGVEAGRDYEPRFADIRESREGDTCPECGGALRFQTAIEVGHIFKFGVALLRAPRCDVPRRGRDRRSR